jgi:hypothetical protein
VPIPKLQGECLFVELLPDVRPLLKDLGGEGVMMTYVRDVVITQFEIKQIAIAR